MAKNSTRGKAEAFMKSHPAEQQWHLRLYVRGESPLTPAAIDNVRAICEAYVPGDHQLEIIDIDENPERAADEQIIALPTLVRLSPEPVRRLVGDLSDQKRVVVALNLRAAGE
jgi:circadian clock protein KaiB